MPLQKQQIPIYFTGGVDTKSPEQLVQPGSFTLLENCVRRKQGRIEKRYGFEHLSRDVVNGADIASGLLLDRFREDLILFSDEGLYSYGTGADRWVRRGDIPTADITSTPLVRNSYRQAMGDIAEGNNLLVTVYQDSRTSAGQEAIRYTVVDTDTGASLVSDVELSANAINPRVVALTTNFLVFYVESSNVKCRIISVGTPTEITAEITLDSAAGNLLDAVAYQNFAVFAYQNSDTSTYKISYVDSTGAVGNGANGMPTPATASLSDPITCMSLAVDAANTKIYLGMATATDVYVNARSIALFSSVTDTVDTISQVCNITIVPVSNSLARFYFETGNTSALEDGYVTRIWESEIDYDYTAITSSLPTVFTYSVGLAAKGFYDGEYTYVWSAYESALQSTYFLIRDDGYIVARVAPGLAAGLTREAESAAPSPSARQAGLCTTIAIDDDYVTALPIRTSLRAAEDGTVYSPSVGLQRIDVTLGSRDLFGASLGGNYVLAGGIATMYDGAAPVELGFNLYPEYTTATASTSGGSLADGTYWYSAIYEWVDAQGQIHRSAPSPLESAEVSGGGGNGSIEVLVRALKLTEKNGTTRPNAKVVLYRGQTAGDFEILHRLSEQENDPEGSQMTFTDTGAISSATLAVQEVLYTTGGVLENTAPPASRFCVQHKNRLFLGGLEDGNSLAYTREHVYGEGPNFSGFLSIQVDSRGGDITALATLDDKLVIFKRDAILTLVGDGPVDTGAQNDYSSPQLVAGDIGCAYPRSIAMIPAGVLFKSDKGIYLLDRALGTSYIGAPVEEYNAETITSAVVMEDVNEVRFTTTDGPTLVYNYYFDQWSTFVGTASASAVVGLSSTYLRLLSDGTVCRETADTYLDAGATFSMAIETGWLSFDQLQGYQRIYRLYALGDFVTDHYTRIKLGYDFEPGYTETVYFNVDEGLNLSYYGDDATYGSGSPYGSSSSSVYQWELAPRRQKCQAIRIRIDDIDTKVSGGGASFRLVGLSAVVGLKKAGGPKLSGSKDIGSLT